MAVLRNSFILGTALCLTTSASAQDCSPFWAALPGHQATGCATMLEFDDGGGPALFLGGSGGIWRYRGAAAERVLTTPAYILRFRQLVVNGQLTTYALSLGGVFRWSGTNWDRVLNAGMADAAVFDDGNGPELYLSSFTRVYRGLSTSTVIANMPAVCGPTSMAVWNDGSGSKLYLGGFFATVNGLPASAIAAWDGATWSAVGGGLSGSDNTFPCGPGVMDLLVHDDGRGPALFAAGSFLESAGNPMNAVARWDGQTWEGVGGGVDRGFLGHFAVVPYQGTTELWALGNYTAIGGIPASGIARWNGSRWDAPLTGVAPSDLNGINALAAFTDSAGEAIFVGGDAMARAGAVDGQIAVARYGCQCADLDGDGAVGLSDLALVLANFGQNGASANGPGNVDHDRNVDLGDLSILLSQFGTTCD